MKVLLVLVISCLNFVSFGQETLTIQQIISSYETIDEKYKSDLPWQELNEETQIARQKEYQNILEQIAQIKKSDLAVSDQINTQMLTLILENEVANTTFDIDKMPLNAEGGFLTGVLYNVRSFRVTDPESFEKYKEKLATLPTHFDQRIEC